MTKFVTYYKLFPIPDPKEFLGLSADCEEGNVLTTLGRNIVVVVKISTQKQIRSWSVTEKLSSKVVFDRLSQKYVGVFANHAVRCWDENTVDVNKCKKLKFQRSIVELISNDENIFVLYNDGECELLAAALESRKEQSGTEASSLPSPNLSISNAKISSLDNGEKLLTYFEHNNKTGILHLVCSSLTQSDETRRFELKRENEKIAGYAVMEGDEAPMLLTIWSDKRIFLLSLHSSVTAEHSPGNFVSKLSDLNVENPLSVLGLSQHFVAIYGANNGQEGSSLLLYNTQFKVVKAKQFFKVYFNFSRLWATDEQILLAMGQNVSVVSYRMSKELLADLIGTQSSNDYTNPIEMDHINEEEALEQSIKYDHEATTNSTEFNSLPSAKINIQIVEADGKSVPFESIDYFDNQLKDLCKMQIQAEVIEVDHAIEDAQLTLMSNYSDDGPATVDVQSIARQMERCGASEHEISEKLLTVLIKADQPQHIIMCLRRYTNISEKILAKTVSYALSKYKLPINLNMSNSNDMTESMEQMNVQDTNAESENEHPNTNASAERCENDSYDVLNAALACTFNPNTIAEHVRREIDYQQMLLLLQHLHSLLADPLSVFEERPGYEANCTQLEMQVLRWFGVLLNTHFQQLLLSKDVELMDILLRWHELFIDYQNEGDELENVAALLYNLVQRRQIKTDKNFSKWYSIEEVVLY